MDALRVFALARVVLWHTVPAVWLTWLAAMPVMFFVAGAMVAASLERSTYRDMLRSRLGRLLPPVWVFGGFVAIVSLGRGVLDRDLGIPGPVDLLRFVGWLVPVIDPASPGWQAGWLTTPLWYLRAYVWLLVLAPIVVAAARRPRVGLVAAGALMVVLEWAAAEGRVVGTPRIVLGDLVTFGIFGILGARWMMSRRSATLPAAPRTPLLVTAAGAAGGAVAWATVVEPGTAVVSNSYPLTLLAGVALLSLIGAFEGPLRRMETIPSLRRTVRAVAPRMLTIYLWHPAAIVVAWAAVDGDDSFGARLMRVVVVVALTATAVAAVGWVEDLRAARPDRYQLAGLGAVAVAGVLIAVPLADVTGHAAGASQRVPSFREPLASSAFASQTPDRSPSASTPQDGASPTLSRALQETLDRWLEDRPDVTAASVAIAWGDDENWEGLSIRDGGTTTRRAGETFRTASMTKTFTAALVLLAASEGLIDLDAPIPTGATLPANRGRPVTPRQLLNHTAGLVEHFEVPGGADPAAPPTMAIARSLAADRRNEPGAAVAYTSTAYHYLGLLLEAATSRPYAELVGGLAESVGLASLRVAEGVYPTPAAGGVEATAADLARWGAALLSKDSVLPPGWRDEMLDIDVHPVGLGVWPTCPCWRNEDGSRGATSFGHHVGDGGLYVWPGELSVVVRLEPGGPLAIEQSLEIGERLRAVLSGGP